MKEPLFISFCTQKGGVGKSTMTILAADWLHFVVGLNIAVIDCDFPQHSIDEFRSREKQILASDETYKLMMMRQFTTVSKKAYPILRCRPDTAISEVKNLIEYADTDYDVILFDLPGTINTAGVIYIMSSLDYLFVPMRADRLIMQSTLYFAKTINERFIQNPAANTKGVYLFWNMVDRREKPNLYTPFEKLLDKLNLSYFKTRIPMRSKFNKEIPDSGTNVYRSTIFAPDKTFLAECGFSALMQEVCDVLNVKKVHGK